jgi:hypothetical protein
MKWTHIRLSRRVLANCSRRNLSKKVITINLDRMMLILREGDCNRFDRSPSFERDWVSHPPKMRCQASCPRRRTQAHRDQKCRVEYATPE